MPKKQDLTNRRFGRLLVLSEADPNGKHIQWNTVCDCGKTKVVPTTNLLRGRSTSCGCLRSEVMRKARLGIPPKGKLPQGASARNILYKQYKRLAEQRGYDFDLTLEFFSWITQQNCQYCGAPPAQNCHRKRSNGAYIYNGIDRLDNSHGYFEWNVAPCCGVCNRMKMSMDYPEFITQIERIYHYHSRNTPDVFPRDTKE